MKCDEYYRQERRDDSNFDSEASSTPTLYNPASIQSKFYKLHLTIKLSLLGMLSDACKQWQRQGLYGRSSSGTVKSCTGMIRAVFCFACT